MKVHFLVILIICSLHVELFAQRLVQDTLSVSIQSKNQKAKLVVPVRFHDKRDAFRKFIGKDETTHFVFIPVDQLIYTRKPLAEEIASTLKRDPDNQTDVRLDLDIRYFWVSEKSSSLLYPHYQLNAVFSVYKTMENQQSEYVGDLVYDTYSYKPVWESNKRKGFSRVLTKWQGQFVEDINQFTHKNSLENKHLPDNLHSSVWDRNPLNMLGECDVMVGSDFYLTDFQVWFSDREADSWFIRSGGYNLRYRNMKQYEAIEIGLSIDRLYYRLNPGFLFALQSNLMVGINRWKDMDTADHTLYDILCADLSLSQSIQYNPLDKNSLIIGAGIYEEIIYNYVDDYTFNLALMLKIGIKL